MKLPRPPLLVVGLLALWLIVNESLAVHHWLLGLVFAVIINSLVTALRPLRSRPRRLLVAVSLCAHVLVDVIRSNLAVGRIILGTRAQPRIGFMKIPLQMRDPHGLAALAVIISSTPGTVWSGHDRESNILTLHVLDLQDEETWLRIIQDRYERPLMEIFE